MLCTFFISIIQEDSVSRLVHSCSVAKKLPTDVTGYTVCVLVCAV